MRKYSWTIALFAIFVIALTGFVSCKEDGTTNDPGTTTTVINIAAIPGITNPAIGGTPALAVDTAQYSGTVQWRVGASGSQNLDGNFAASTVYRAIITLTAKSGFTLTGVGANFFTVNGIQGTNTANSGIVTVTFDATPAQPIDVTDFAISGIVKPITGAEPAQMDNADNTQYTGTIEWKKASDDSAACTTFSEGTSYKAVITLARTGNYVFTAVTAGTDKFTLEGIVAEDIISIENSAGTATGITVTVVFKPTEAPVIVNIANIVTVTAPAVGVTDVSNIDTAQYTGSIVWAPELIDNKFLGETIYTATMTLTIKPGLNFTFADLADTFFNVGGVATTIKPGRTSNTVVVEAVFPVTNPLVLSELEIEGIDPVGYEEPVTSLSADQYTAAITWKNDSDEDAGDIFTIGTVYTATVTLSAKTGFAFNTAISASDISFIGAHASEEIVITIDGTVTPKTLKFTAEFPSTEGPEPITIVAISGIQIPSTINRPVTEITPAKGAAPDAEVQFTGAVTWDPTPLNGAFQAGETYTATITLTVGHHFSFIDVLENTFNVAGATVTHGTITDPREHELEVKAVFPATPACALKNCEDGDGCVVYGLTVNDGYPFSGSASIRGIEDQTALKNAPVYSTLGITFGDNIEGQGTTSSMGRLGEGDVRINMPSYGALPTNRTWSVPIADIRTLMADTHASDPHSEGDRFNINSWRAYIVNITLHTPTNDPRPKCPVCDEHGCEDHCLYCENLIGTGVGECDGFCGTVAWTLQSLFTLHPSGLTITSGGASNMRPLRLASGTAANNAGVIKKDEADNMYLELMVGASGNGLNIILGTHAQGIGITNMIDNRYAIRVRGSVMSAPTTNNATAIIDLRFRGFATNTFASARAQEGDSFEIMSELIVEANPGSDSGHTIQITSSGSNQTAGFPYTIRIDSIEIVNRTPVAP